MVMTLYDEDKRLIFLNGVWVMHYRTANEYTLEQTLTMYDNLWRVVKIEPHGDNVNTYTLIEIEQDNDNGTIANFT